MFSTPLQSKSMTQLEYSDRHRFIASTGVALIVVSIAAPLLYLREPFDLMLEKSKAVLLTETAQVILAERQNLVLALSNVLPWISLMLFISGLIILFFGLYGWGKKQDIQDETEKLNLDMLKQKLTPMTIEEVNQKTDSGENDGELKINSNIDLKNITKPGLIENDVESLISKKIQNNLSGKYQLFQNVKIGGRGIDAVLAKEDGYDILFEIKYFKKSPSLDLIYRTRDRLNSLAQTYEQETKRMCEAKIIIVVPNIEVLEKVKDLVANSSIPRVYNKYGLSLNYFIEGQELNDMEINEIIN